MNKLNKLKTVLSVSESFDKLSTILPNKLSRKHNNYKNEDLLVDLFIDPTNKDSSKILDAILDEMTSFLIISFADYKEAIKNEKITLKSVSNNSKSVYNKFETLYKEDFGFRLDLHKKSYLIFKDKKTLENFLNSNT